MQHLDFKTKKPLKKIKNWGNFMIKWQGLSESRLEGIEIANRQFDDYCVNVYGRSRDEIIDYIKSFDDEDQKDDLITDLVQEWIHHLHASNVVSVIRVKISGVNKYLRYKKIAVDTKELVYPQALYEEPHAISIDEILAIFRVSKYHKIAYYLALISTGARPIEITGLRKHDIVWNREFNCYTALIPAQLTKKKIARTIKFSRECSSYITNLLEKAETKDSQVFSKNKNLKYARSNEDKVFKNYCEKVGFDDKFETTGRMKINLYCFRAYFFTHALDALSDSKDMAHAFIGHGAYLQQYQRRTLEEKIELWDQVESSISIFDLTKKNNEIKKLKDEQQNIDSLKKMVHEMQQKRSIMPDAQTQELIMKILKEKHII